MKRLRSSRTRLVLSHVLVAVVAVAATLDILIAQVPVDWINNSESIMAGVEWLMNAPDHAPNPIRNNQQIPGFALVVSSENRVLHSVGNTPCYADMALADCAPGLLNLDTEDRYFTEDGQQWWEVTRIMSGGERIIARRVRYNGEPSMMIGTTEIRGSLPFLIFSSVAGILVALPFALVLAWLLVRLQTRRLVRLAQISRRFAQGDFNARVLSKRGDMIGALSQQFDSMADALQHNMDGLRTLAGRHRELARQAEQAAGAAERARVAHDLHDKLAQQIFNLSVTASSLADSIEQPSPQNVEIARQLARCAEDTLLHLRGVLVDLRADAGDRGATVKFNLLYLRLIASHIAVAALTMLILIILYLASMPAGNASDDLPWYSDPQLVAHDVIRNWLIGVPDGQPNGVNQIYIPGFALVISMSDKVLYSQGDTDCRMGMTLDACAPDLINIPDERLVDVNGQQWPEVTIPLVDGTHIISRREPVPSGELLAISNSLFARGQFQFMALLVGIASIIALPLALLVVWRFVNPQARRLVNIARMSRDFAGGDFGARVNDPTADEIGELARQFDDMAAVLEQNIAALQDLVQRNDLLAQQAEQSAVRAERLRLARDLHDSIAQRLFSVSMTAAALPNAIQNRAPDSQQQLHLMAALADEAQDDLRAVMVDVRPASVIERGLGEALEHLCEDWEALNPISLERSFLLSGAPIPPTVEDVLYRVAQEALNNTAKHGGATSAQMLLVQGQQQVTLSISDNGRGFDVSERGAGGGFGLLGMRERTDNINGALNIESRVGHGTTVELVVTTGTAH